MGTYLLDGHKVDLYIAAWGYYCYLDDDMEPLDVSQAELNNIIENGVRI